MEENTDAYWHEEGGKHPSEMLRQEGNIPF